MSIRLRKQIKKVGVFDIRPKYGDRGAVIDTRDYSIVDRGGFGDPRNRLQEWRSKERKTDWFVTKGVVSPDTMLSPRHDRTSILSRVSSSPSRMGTMASRVPRAPVELDSRRGHEKTSVVSVLISGIKNTAPNTLGPGKYMLTSDRDFGRTSNGPAWSVSKDRQTNWWFRRSEAPTELVDLTLHPSRSRVGGRDSVLWPLLEDENGEPITDDPYEYIRTISRGGSRACSRAQSRAATPNPSKLRAWTS